ncbi:MAG: methyltransferase domain-containing protein [Gemmatimonadetes bacterium]|nr:methyltransferase domain-containing protein [Gemmatimonadota bacterium]NIO30280.1 methyltransferase domain-containing protein [Gemmatimonadota bacterium]
MTDAGSFWEDPDRVEEFAGREPDRRLVELLESFEQPGVTRVLDLGCAGGRNTAVLAERGFDVQAIDSSSSMVARTRGRVETLLGNGEAERRVRVGRMEDLSDFASGSFQLVVALGVYHNAVSEEKWEQALKETARVLVPHGLVLVATFTPDFRPHGEKLRRVAGSSHLYEGFDAGPLYLLEADELDAEMARHGMVPVVPTETVEAATDTGRRVTANGLYRKRGR